VRDSPQAVGRPQQLWVGELLQLHAQLRAVWRQHLQHQREQRDVPAMPARVSVSIDCEKCIALEIHHRRPPHKHVQLCNRKLAVQMSRHSQRKGQVSAPVLRHQLRCGRHRCDTMKDASDWAPRLIQLQAPLQRAPSVCALT